MNIFLLSILSFKNKKPSANQNDHYFLCSHKGLAEESVLKLPE